MRACRPTLPKVVAVGQTTSMANESPPLEARHRSEQELSNRELLVATGSELLSARPKILGWSLPRSGAGSHQASLLLLACELALFR